MRTKLLGGLAVAAVLAVLLSGRTVPAGDATPAPDKAAVERTRETVRMIDDLYKGAVVHITGTYVEAQESVPAAKVAKKVFAHMEKQGWHSARLIDATGKPLGEPNVAKTEFEKKAVEALKGGKPYFDEVGTKNGKPVLRAATVVPVVMKQCMACHQGRKMGDLLGAIVYEVPIK